MEEGVPISKAAMDNKEDTDSNKVAMGSKAVMGKGDMGNNSKEVMANNKEVMDSSKEAMDNSKEVMDNRDSKALMDIIINSHHRIKAIIVTGETNHLQTKGIIVDGEINLLQIKETIADGEISLNQETKEIIIVDGEIMVRNPIDYED